MSKRALVISPQPFFSARGTPFSVYYRTWVTAQKGVEIDLLTYGDGQDVDLPGVRIIRIPRFKFLGPIKIGPSPQKLFLDVFLFLWTVALLASRRYDFVHAHEEAVFFCRYLKPIFRFKLIYDMHSSLPQQLTNFQFTTSRAIIGVFERMEQGSLRQADAVITICPDLATYALKSGVPQSRHFLIENSLFDDVQLKTNGQAPASNGNGATPLQLPGVPADRPVILYAGTFEPYQGLEILIDAFAIVHQQRPDALLVLVGGGDAQQIDPLRARAAKLNLEGHCLITGRIPKGEARRIILKAAVLTSPRKHGTNTPLKIYELLAGDAPLVATRIWSHTQILDDEVCILVEPEAGSMAEGVLLALNDGARRDRVVRGAKQLYQSKYSPAAYHNKISQLLAVVS
jgi:glycosyltransferase involved in cell wall biosynthesis